MPGEPPKPDRRKSSSAFHQRLGVDLPERDYPALLSVDGAVRYLEAHLGTDGSAL
jgi:hypothetical protein